MYFQVDGRDRIRAKNPHELFMLNLIAFHLLLAPAAIALGIGEWALLLPVFFSLLVMLVIFVLAKRAESRAPWFVMAHWKAALLRCRLLLIGYAISGVALLLAWLLSLGMQPSMRSIMLTALTRVAVMPTVILVFVSFVLESSALFQATRGEVADGVVARYPAPAGLAALEEQTAG